MAGMELKVGNRRIEAGRIFCIGMNYAEHVRELGNTIPESPVIFMKPSTSLVPAGRSVRFPSHGSELHFEAELVVLIGQNGRPEKETDALRFIGGLSLGLDLTLRDVQARLKKAGHPWEASKAFDDSAPLGDFIPFDDSIDLGNIAFCCVVNGEIRQRGNTSDMIFPVLRLIHAIGRIWTLREGDLIYTGTPPGVGALRRGDEITLEGERFGAFYWRVV